jgi:hypothetical protein
MGIGKLPNVSSPYEGGVVNNASFVIGTEAANAITVNIQLKDGLKDVAQRVALTAYLSADANGDSLTALATPTFAAGTDGVVATLVSGKMVYMISEADGDIDLVITYTTGAGSCYLILVMPDGSLVASTVITFA